MPIYEYGCPDCGERVERMQKISEPPLDVCPSCGSTQIRKLVSQTSFTLKGSGWYSDHYGLKSGGGDRSGGGDKSAAASSGDKPAASPDRGGSGSGGSGSGGSGSGGSSAGGSSAGGSSAGGSSAGGSSASAGAAG